MLEARGFPEGFANSTEGLYFMAVCLWIEGDAMIFIFFSWSGGLQGYPLSGLLFNVSMDPLVCATNKIDSQHGSLTKYCADDVGSSLAHPGPSFLL